MNVNVKQHVIHADPRVTERGGGGELRHRARQRESEGHESEETEKGTKTGNRETGEEDEAVAERQRREEEQERWRSLTRPPVVKINHEPRSVLKCRPAAERSAAVIYCNKLRF